MKKFIGSNLRYPEEALKNKIEGTVYLRYDIDHQGTVTDAKVVKGIGLSNLSLTLFFLGELKEMH